MDFYSSGEDLVVKTRKPYTITKQRERWTEEEHNKFLEAIKLYGRAWQRIEEHVGTKTAVQIRSHAQKFFTKLEKEAMDKGVGHTLDIEIPPPRPKKKPSNPYPRKTNVGASTSLVGFKDGKTPNPISFSCQSTMSLPLEKEIERPCEIGKLENNAGFHERANCTETLTLVKTACASSVPLLDGASNQDEASVSEITIEAKELQTENNKQLLRGSGSFDILNAVDSDLTHKQINEVNQSTDDKQPSSNYPQHVPAHILDGSLGTWGQDISADMSYSEPMVHQMCEVHDHQNQFMNPTASATSEPYNNASRSSIHQSIPSFQPIFTPIQNQDDYLSFLHVSSTFSSLIVSALSQNPAAYAAASLATNMWPWVNMEASGEPSTASKGTFQSQSIHSAPNMAAIAAATVAAATAWWAAHGLLPLCAPFHPGFTHPPASVSATPMDINQGRAVNGERRERSPNPAISGQQLEPECSEAFDEQHSVSKSPNLSSSDSDANEGAKLKVESVAAETEKNADSPDMQDENEPKPKKQVDRSSCGSNTSSSEVEAEPTNDKDEKQSKEESEELNATHTVGDTFRQRCRSTSNGRLAFQALFSREVLPQSFSPPQYAKNKGKKYCSNQNESGEEEKDRLVLEINGETMCAPSSQHVEDITVNNGSSFIGYAKLKGCRSTGFKPYKRCSVEAKESNRGVSQDGDKGAKRLRLHEETTSTL